MNHVKKFNINEGTNYKKTLDIDPLQLYKDMGAELTGLVDKISEKYGVNTSAATRSLSNFYQNYNINLWRKNLK